MSVYECCCPTSSGLHLMSSRPESIPIAIQTLTHDSGVWTDSQCRPKQLCRGRSTISQCSSYGPVASLCAVGALCLTFQIYCCQMWGSLSFYSARAAGAATIPASTGCLPPPLPNGPVWCSSSKSPKECPCTVQFFDPQRSPKEFRQRRPASCPPPSCCLQMLACKMLQTLRSPLCLKAEPNDLIRPQEPLSPSASPKEFCQRSSAPCMSCTTLLFADAVVQDTADAT